MRNFRTSLLSPAALSAFLIAPGALAQDTGIGFGALKRVFNMTDLAGTRPDTTRDTTIEGVVEIGGLLYVSGRNGGSSADHKIYIVDPESTTLLGSFSQPDPHQSDGIGSRDLAKDLSRNILAAGDNGVMCYDIAGNLVDTVTGNNGPIAMSPDPEANDLPVAGNQNGALDRMQSFGTRSFRGLEFDPAGDDGNGSFIIGTSLNACPVMELRISDASILREINDGGGADIDSQGMVFDPLRGTLWTNSSGDFGGGEGLYELDWQNLQDLGDNQWAVEWTGRFIPPQPPNPGMNANNYAGLDYVPGGDPGSPWAAAFDLVSVSQQNRIDNGANDDWIGFHRLHQHQGVFGDDESFLAVAKTSGGNQSSFEAVRGILVKPGDALHFKVDPNHRLANEDGPIPLMIVNLPGAANTYGTTELSLLGLPGQYFPELIAVWPFSNPVDVANTLILSGGAVDGPHLNPPVVNEYTLAPALPPIFQNGHEIRMQVLHFEADAGFPLPQFAASNEAGWLVAAVNTIEFKISGPSAFSVDLLDPFVQLSEFGGGDADTSITKLIISTKRASEYGAITGAMSDLGTTGTGSTLGANAYFDIGQTEMADRFIAGNAFGDLFNPVIASCNGTYRPIDPGGNPFTSLAPRSDLDCGLIYADGLIDPEINTPYNLGRGDPENEDPLGNPDPILPPIDVTSVPPYHADANLLTEWGRGYVECFVEWWPQPPQTDAYPYQSGFIASDGQFGVVGDPDPAIGTPQPGYPPDPPDPQGMWLWWPQTLEFNFTPGRFLGKTFGFDIDIDGVADGGGDLVGLFVEVHLADGTVHSGLTLPETDPDVCVIGW